MMLHYHGTPISPRHELLTMAGRHFCVSHSDPRDAEVCLSIGQSVMWDNGAFSKFTAGKATDWAEYYDWLGPKLAPPHWAIVPDVIDGEEEQQETLLKQWPYPPHVSAAVWHLNESLDRLRLLADRGLRICFGSAGEYWDVGGDGWCRRCDLAFNTLAKSHTILPWVHMLRGLSLSGQRWPFASADSVNVARNFKNRAGRRPQDMAARIDAEQCPVHWQQSHTQATMGFV